MSISLFAHSSYSSMSICLFVHLPVCPFLCFPFVRLSICSNVCLPNRSIYYLSFSLFVLFSVCHSIPSSNSPSIFVTRLKSERLHFLSLLSFIQEIFSNFFSLKSCPLRLPLDFFAKKKISSEKQKDKNLFYQDFEFSFRSNKV